MEGNLPLLVSVIYDRRFFAKDAQARSTRGTGNLAILYLIIVGTAKKTCDQQKKFTFPWAHSKASQF